MADLVSHRVLLRHPDIQRLLERLAQALARTVVRVRRPARNASAFYRLPKVRRERGS